jgi:hypothetical protein
MLLNSCLACWLDHSVKRGIQIEGFETMTRRKMETKSEEITGETGQKCIIGNLLNFTG